MDVVKEIMAAIKQYETIIIHRHQRPDPDAIGSQVGLAELLRASFPEKNIYQVGGPVEGLEFLAEMDVITDDVYRGALVIVTDTANAPRISDARFSLGDQLIKIDHHPNDEPYGDLVWVNTNASSCSEIIVDFWQQHLAELTMTDNAARLLYAGIVGDTGRFLYPSTSAHTLAVAAQLRTFNFNYIYQNLEIDANGAARVVLPQSILNSYDIVDSETAAIVSMPGKIEDVLSWAIFVEQPEGYYRVRLRSKGPIINTIAKKHHGGGHPLASGANARDAAEIEVIYQEIQAACQEWAQK